MIRPQISLGLKAQQTGPKVSVLILTYNHEAYILQALISVLSQQTTFNYEVIVADDCSTDCTKAIVRRFSKEHPTRVIVHRQDRNVGVCLNFASALALCRGEYIALLEGDDYWTCPDKLQLQADYLDKRNNYTLCFHQVHVADPASPLNLIFPRQSQPTLKTEDLLEDNIIPTGSVMFRRDALKEIPLWCAQLKMLDWPLFIFLSQEGYVGFIEQVMGVYRVHSRGIWSQTSQRERSRSIVAALERINRHLGRRYSDLIRQRIAKAHYHIAWCDEEKNLMPGAILANLQAILADPLRNPKYKRNVLRLILKATARELYTSLQRTKPALGRITT